MISRPEILRRLIDVAKRHDPAAARGGTLHHFREAVLLLRARRLRYDHSRP